MTFHEFAQAHSLIIKHLQMGKITRCPTEDHPHKNNGAFLFMGAWGWVQNWACHDEIQTWKDKDADPVIVAKELKLSRDNYSIDRARKGKEAVKKANWILSQCELQTHAYFDSKGFPDELVNSWIPKEGELPLMVIPMYRESVVCGLQLIDTEGTKKFLTGQQNKGAYFKISNESIPDKIFLVEGYATGKSLQIVLNSMKAKYTILICFSANNVKYLANKLPKAKIIVDNDESVTGLKMAESTGLKYWIPPEVGQDFNDFWRVHGTLKCNLRLRNFVYSV